jgi:hypothetical protein
MEAVKEAARGLLKGRLEHAMPARKTDGLRNILHKDRAVCLATVIGPETRSRWVGERCRLLGLARITRISFSAWCLEVLLPPLWHQASIPIPLRLTPFIFSPLVIIHPM